MIKSYRTAQILARKLLDEARENEPQITADLEKIAREVSAEIVGLENKFKSEESLIRKLLLLAEKDTTNKSFDQKLRKFARLNNDVLRYTFVFLSNNYAKGYQLTAQKLEQNGFVMPPNKVWNAWQNKGKVRDTGYRGINTTIISSQNQQFELQFHTTESFRLKSETHNFYEELRDLKTSDERRAEIIKEMLKLADDVKQPEGIQLWNM